MRDRGPSVWALTNLHSYLQPPREVHPLNGRQRLDACLGRTTGCSRCLLLMGGSRMRHQPVQEFETRGTFQTD